MAIFETLVLSVVANGAAPPPAPAPDPVALPSPGVAVALSVGTTLAGVGVFIAGTQVEGVTAQDALIVSGYVLVAIGPWVGRRYGDAVTSRWRNVRLVGLASTKIGLVSLPRFCFDDYTSSETGCGVGAVLAGLGSLVWAVGTLGELATTAGDVRAAQTFRVTPTVGPVPGGAMLGVSGLF